MQIGEEHQILAQPVVLSLDRLLDLEHQLGEIPHLVGGVENPGARGDEVLVRNQRPGARSGLDDDIVTGLGQLEGSCRRERDPILVVLDLAGDANAHDEPPDDRTYIASSMTLTDPIQYELSATEAEQK